MTIKQLLAACALALATNVAFAGKVAVFDFQRAIMQTEQAKKAEDSLKADKEYSQLLAQIESYQTDLRAMAKESETKGMTWSQEQAAEHRKKMEYIQADLQLAVKKVQSENAAVMKRLEQQFKPKIEQSLVEIVEAEGIDVVLPPQAVIWASPTIDITAKVSAAINKTK